MCKWHSFTFLQCGFLLLCDGARQVWYDPPYNHTSFDFVWLSKTLSNIMHVDIFSVAPINMKR